MLEPHPPSAQNQPAVPVAPSPAPNTGEERFRIATLIHIVRRRLYLAISVFLGIFLLVGLVALNQTPRYTADTTVLIDPRTKEIIDFESVLSGLSPDSTIVDTEVKLIRSRDLIKRVITQLDLVNDPEFNEGLPRTNPFGKLLKGLRHNVMELAPHQVRESQKSQDTETIKKHALYQQVVENVTKKLKVQREGLTYLIRISFESTNPGKAANIANAFAEQYLLAQLNAKFDATSRANHWLSERLATLRQELRATENSVENFRAKKGLLSVEGYSLTEQQISDIHRQLAEQKSRLSAAKARSTSVKEKLTRGDDPETIGEVLASPVIRELRRQETEVSRRYGELTARYGPEHPQMIKVKREARDIQTQIDSEVRRIRINLNAEVEIEHRKVDALQNSLALMQKELETNNKSLVRLRELQRDAEASRLLYENFLNRSKQTGEQESLTEADARIVSEAAILTKPSYPKPLTCLLLAIWLGLMGAAMATACAETLDNSLACGNDIETQLGLPYITSVPALQPSGFKAFLEKLLHKQKQNINPIEYLLDKPVSSFTEAFRTIRSSIQLANMDMRPRVVAITSALPGEGKTTIAYCLGRTSVISGNSAIVVDCDLRRRSLSQTALKTSPKYGLLEILSGEADYTSVIQRDKRCALDILPVAKSDFTPKDIFGSEAFRTLLQNLSERYQLVILDTAPVLAVAEVRTIAYFADALFLVAQWRKTRIPAIRSALQILREINARTSGIILSQVDQEERKRFGEGDYSYYYHQYRGYYSEN